MSSLIRRLLDSRGSYKRLFVALCFLIQTVSSHSGEVDLTPVATRTAADWGPRDYVWEEDSSLYPGSIDNNGFSDIRTLMEFDLSKINSSEVIESATLSFTLFNEGQRNLELQSYSGDGAASLQKFGTGNLVVAAQLPDSGGLHQNIAWDVTQVVKEFHESRERYAGFEFNENPYHEDDSLTIIFLEVRPGDYGPKLTLQLQNGDNAPKPGAIVVSDEYCIIADGSIFEHPTIWPELVTTYDGKLVTTNNRHGKTVKICSFDGVYNPTGQAVHYDYESVNTFYGYQFPCRTGSGDMYTTDWFVRISATGKATMVCRF